MSERLTLDKTGIGTMIALISQQISGTDRDPSEHRKGWPGSTDQLRAVLNSAMHEDFLHATTLDGESAIAAASRAVDAVNLTAPTGTGLLKRRPLFPDAFMDKCRETAMGIFADAFAEAAIRKRQLVGRDWDEKPGQRKYVKQDIAPRSYEEYVTFGRNGEPKDKPRRDGGFRGRW